LDEEVVVSSMYSFGAILRTLLLHCLLLGLWLHLLLGICQFILLLLSLLFVGLNEVGDVLVDLELVVHCGLADAIRLAQHT